MGVTAGFVYWNTDSEVTHINKLNFPGYKYHSKYIDMSSSPKNVDTGLMTISYNVSRKNQEELKIYYGMNDPPE